MSCHLTPYERETIINFNEAEDVAYVYTHNRSWIRKLSKAEWAELVEEFYSSDGKLIACEFRVPKRAVKVSLRKPTKKIASECQKVGFLA